ncbi:protein of unknown function [Limimonas halophila]|uniref:DUF4062 domain-containing protein n=1 Tax=Limimonas halophila TaxID=1082479 RepID=A0A1G7SSD0_9PROT|nr:DUF4062 domain-containing protein [Limimonas halophila]SDG25997.1 protein of unknown function [Limimonas halophila]
MKVFISSVMAGMEEHRDAADRAARALGHEVIRAEDFGARPESPQVACLAGVREADAVILIMGARYGALQPSGLSPTHEEYREARERRPVLVMVESGAEHDLQQEQFLSEVRDWEMGHYTGSFTTPDELRDAVTNALHSFELAHATGSVDPDEMLQRATDLLPEPNANVSTGQAQLAVALSGGPYQSVLRPAELEAEELKDYLQRAALFGDAAVFTPKHGTQTEIKGDTLIMKQTDRSIFLTETGSCLYVTDIPRSSRGLPVIVEEDIRELINGVLCFGDVALDYIDRVKRLSHVTIATRILGAEHLGWRTRAEHERNPNHVQMGHPTGAARKPVSLSPPHVPRAALRHDAGRIVEDLVVRLRQGFR